MRKLTAKHILPFLMVLVIAACAKVGSPDGGPYDETPPKLVMSTPRQNAVNNTAKKIVLEFDENIKIENASEKVLVSPPQIEQPEIKTSGRKVTVELLDSLKKNTTYSIDFADAIVDNNEGNPMGNFAYTFSTGEAIDTMEVSGTVLNAEDLEPIKGIMVGLYSDLSDSAFTKKPMERIARTNGSGKFVIKGVAPGKYHVFALQDADQNYEFSQKSEKLAFLDSLIIPDSKPDIRMDTVWTDSIHYDSVYQVPYTHFLPDNIVLTAFQEEQTTRYLVKNERPVPERFSLVFSTQSDTFPKLRGLNFQAEDAFIIESNSRKDTLQYWIKDTLVSHQDTLSLEMTYLATDTLGNLVSKIDTLNLSPKKSLEKIQKEKQQQLDDWKKEQKKKEKKGLPFDSIPPVEELALKISPTGEISPDADIHLDFEQPLSRMDTAGVHLFLKQDSLWIEEPYYLDTRPDKLFNYDLIGEWRPEQEYKLKVDSACCIGMYGAVNKPQEITFKVPKLDTYASLFVNVKGTEGPVIVQLMSGDKPAKEVTADEKGQADFYFIKPGKYYLRALADKNNDGKWTTGEYASRQQAEEVFYYPGEFDLKANWEITQDWNVREKPLDKQKPAAITKQKPDTEKKVKNRNAERERKLRKNNSN